ncbi:MAG: ABC transporter permease, partial [Halanaerobiales bacterium]
RFDLLHRWRLVKYNNINKLVFWIILNKTTFGKYIFSIGNGERATILSGIKVDRVRIIAFVLNSTLVAFGGILLFGRLASGNPNVGESYLLPAIASVIVGGTDLTGGFGGIKRTIVGVFIITLIKNGMNVIGVEAFVQQIVYGIIIIIFAALAIDRSKIEILK